MSLRFAYYGDDFTGATDTLSALAGAGLRTLLFLGVPSRNRLAACGELDALGIAGAARAMGRDAMRQELEPVAQFFAGIAAPVLHYKCCSTYDSALEVGNLAQAIAVLRQALQASTLMPVVGGQPNLERYCAFGNLFAAAGSGGVVHRIDRHPTMSCHPVTPMHEADLRRHLTQLGMRQVEGINWRELEAQSAIHSLQQRLQTLAAQAPDAVLFDVLTDEHLNTIGQVLWPIAQRERMLTLGPSSVAQAFVAAWKSLNDWPIHDTPLQDADLAADTIPVPVAADAAPPRDPVFVLAGSLSPVTAAQLDHGRAFYTSVSVDPTLLGDADRLNALANQCAQLLCQGQSVIARTDRPVAGGPDTNTVAQRCGRLLAAVLARAPEVRRVGVLGGDTSSRAVQALGVWGLSWMGSLSTGVQWVRAHADDPRLDGLALMLKGGQMGSVDILTRLHRQPALPTRSQT